MTVEFLGIDLSRAFDTIRRDKLLDTLQTFLGESELRMIRFLLADSSLQPRLSTGDCLAFATTIGTPQGDSLSPVLFTVYLEAALRDLRSRLPTRPPEDAALPLDVDYADYTYTDFISTSRSFLDDIERIAAPCLAEWSLTINGSKTERTSISRHVDRIEEEWLMTRKLGSLPGEAEDVARRKQLANVAFRKLWTVWFRRAQISLQLRLRLYASFVIPVLTFNMGTWGLQQADQGWASRRVVSAYDVVNASYLPTTINIYDLEIRSINNYRKSYNIASFLVSTTISGRCRFGNSKPFKYIRSSYVRSNCIYDNNRVSANIYSYDYC